MPPMQNVDLSAWEDDGYLLVMMHGELDVADAAEVAAALIALASRNPVVILDLAGLRFIDCSGVRALVRALEHSAGLRLACPRTPVLRVLAMTGMTDTYPPYGSIGDAVNGRSGAASCRPAQDAVLPPA